MKLLVLSRYGQQGASSRLRMFQYLPYLHAAGIDVEVSPFFADSYLQALYAGLSSGRSIIGYYASRARNLLVSQRPDAIWLEKEAFPWIPFALERGILPRNVPCVTDYDDAVFHRYDQHANPVIRKVLGSKIDQVMGNSALVLAGNAYLADRAEKAGAPRVEVVPTVVDVNAYSTMPCPSPDGRLRIGWIGTPSTWREYGLPMVPLLTDVARKHGARVRIVGATDGVPADGDFECLPWSEESESKLIQEMDIGLMPLHDSPWSQGKCGYKLIQYMACGLPVVASPVGVNSDIVVHGTNGFLATTDSDWHHAIDTLLGNAELRIQMGTLGRKKVENCYSLQKYGPIVSDLLNSVVY
ncbi:glycosyltransferase family 4 protein [Nitratireductor aestuarii]|nr:glycosyltransferase family 4 protein [Nitratireductor aestuarii]